MTSGFSAIVPAVNRDAANADLEARGYGPENFGVAAGRGTHAMFHCWNTPQSAPFKTYLQSIAVTYGITIRDTEANRPVEQVKALADGMSIEWPPADEWLENLPMAGNVLQFDDKWQVVDSGGTEYRSLIDRNVWSPKAYPRGWELVEKPAGPQVWEAGTVYIGGATVTGAVGTPGEGRTWTLQTVSETAGVGREPWQAYMWAVWSEVV